jgi:hypothetical protein
MNERIKELAEQAGYNDKADWYREYDKFDLERFAELVRQDEREACAKLVERMSDSTWTFCNFAEAIRARGDKNESRSNN